MCELDISLVNNVRVTCLEFGESRGHADLVGAVWWGLRRTRFHQCIQLLGGEVECRTVLGQRRKKVSTECCQRDIRLVRQDGEGGCSRRLGAAGGAPALALDEHACDVQHAGGKALDKLGEAGSRNPNQVRVTQRLDRGGARFPREQRHLADHLSASTFAQRRPCSIGSLRKDPQPSVHDQVRAVTSVTLAKQLFTGRQRNPIQVGFDGVDQRLR